MMQRIAGTPEPPEAQSDEALAQSNRVVLAIDIERVPPNYIPSGTQAAL